MSRRESFKSALRGVMRVVRALWGAVRERDWRLAEIAAVLEGGPQESPGNFVPYCCCGCGRRATASVTVQAAHYANEYELREARAIECVHKDAHPTEGV